MTVGTTPLVEPRAPVLPPPDAPVTALTVLYDADCSLCRWAREWLESQPTWVRLEFVPAASRAAAERFPALDPARTLREVTVVAQDGRVWTGDAAWIACLWATRAHRSLSAWLASPAARPLTRQVVASVSAYRPRAGGYGETGGQCGEGCSSAGSAGGPG
ncbi:MAG: DUF393 domain-containing protein [Actinomycetota bacterium]|nr:DUF393 domain-containing protein [Actinomycetota bacterium]